MGNLSTWPIFVIVIAVLAALASWVAIFRHDNTGMFKEHETMKKFGLALLIAALLAVILWAIIAKWQPVYDREKLVELITKDRTYFVALATDGTAYATVLKSVAEPVVKEIEDKDLQDIIKLVEDKDTTKPAHVKLVNDLSEKYALGQVLATKDAPVLDPPEFGGLRNAQW